MSEILIKGMEMPKTEKDSFLVIIRPNEVIYHYDEDEFKRYEAVELPPHGDLKDVNKIIEDIKKHYCHNSRFCDERCSCCDFEKIISVIEYDIPTVLRVSK